MQRGSTKLHGEGATPERNQDAMCYCMPSYTPCMPWYWLFTSTRETWQCQTYELLEKRCSSYSGCNARRASHTKWLDEIVADAERAVLVDSRTTRPHFQLHVAHRRTTPIARFHSHGSLYHVQELRSLAAQQGVSLPKTCRPFCGLTRHGADSRAHVHSSCCAAQDCWNRAICSSPDAWMDVMNRKCVRSTT